MRQMISACQIIHGLQMATLCALLIPFCGFLPILLHAISPFIAPAKIAHGIAVAAFGTAAIPVKRPFFVLFHAFAALVAACQIMHALQIATLICSCYLIDRMNIKIKEL